MTTSGTAAEPPLAGLAAATMRRFVAETGRRRLVPTTAHVGVPLGECRSVPDEGWYDAGARAELVARALEGIAAPGPLCLWLSRSGDLADGDRDLAWLAAARDGFGAHGLVPWAVFVVTRRGWADLQTGVRHRWSRVRPVQEPTRPWSGARPGPSDASPAARLPPGTPAALSRPDGDGRWIQPQAGT